MDINNRHETFASLNETGQTVMCDLESGEVLAGLQSKLDDINDRGSSLNARLIDVRHKLDGGDHKDVKKYDSMLNKCKDEQ